MLLILTIITKFTNLVSSQSRFSAFVHRCPSYWFPWRLELKASLKAPLVFCFSLTFSDPPGNFCLKVCLSLCLQLWPSNTPALSHSSFHWTLSLEALWSNTGAVHLSSVSVKGVCVGKNPCPWSVCFPSMWVLWLNTWPFWLGCVWLGLSLLEQTN